MGRARLVVADLVLSFLWVWAGSLVKLFVYQTVGPRTPHEVEILKISLSVGYMFIFAWFDKLTGGGSYNPLTVLIYTIAGNGGYLFAAFCRIPAQVNFICILHPVNLINCCLHDWRGDLVWTESYTGSLVH
jgi:aquaporin SIP